MKKIYIIAALSLAATAMQAQKVVFSCDFEEGMPSTFATYDLDGNEPSRSMKSYGLTEGVAWAAFNDGENTALYSGSWYKIPGTSNDWMVTSPIRVEDVRNILSWRAYALDAKHPDGYSVYISTTGNHPEDFVDSPVYTVAAESGQWQQHAVSLADYVGRDIYVAFVNNSTNCNILAIDDINVFAYDHSFNFINTTPEAISSPGIVHVTGEISSSGFLPVEGYVVELTYAGMTEVIDRSSDIVAADSVAHIEFAIDIDVPLDATSDYTLRISSLDGTDVLDVVSSITCFHRTVLIEEGTGTWCMWCPRGAYGLELMHEKYPGTFVDVAVHGSDEMMNIPYYVGAYNYFTMGFPGCILDRNTELAGDPYYDIDSLLNTAMKKGAIGKISTTAQYINSRQLAVEATVEFGKTIAEGEYGLLYIIVEDSVTGYEQANAYGGGNTPMGGFENLPDPIPAGEYYFANVGRMVYPSFTGDAEAFPAGTPRHTPMTVSYTIDMPEVQRMEMVKVVAAITEMSTGKIVNIHEVVPSIPEAVKGINAAADISVRATANGIEIVAAEALQSVEVWSVGGQLLYTAQPHYNTHVVKLDDNHGIVVVKACTAQDSIVAKCVK
ncbi:MAG: choice-of-anchor J domain-containing protein [Bacteroidaceae bacterium]|nr:choice-of-anchor J domain-containing protein [Bacteroidaceae bacterium]